MKIVNNYFLNLLLRSIRTLLLIALLKNNPIKKFTGPCVDGWAHGLFCLFIHEYAGQKETPIETPNSNA